MAIYIIYMQMLMYMALLGNTCAPWEDGDVDAVPVEGIVRSSAIFPARFIVICRLLDH